MELRVSAKFHDFFLEMAVFHDFLKKTKIHDFSMTVSNSRIFHDSGNPELVDQETETETQSYALYTLSFGRPVIKDNLTLHITEYINCQIR